MSSLEAMSILLVWLSLRVVRILDVVGLLGLLPRFIYIIDRGVVGDPPS